MRRASLLLLAAIACKRLPVEARSDAGDGGPIVAPDGSEAVASPRCKVAGEARPLGGDARDVEVGEVVDTDDGLAIGQTRLVEGKRMASVALVPNRDATVMNVDLDPAPVEGPPPVPFRVGRSVGVFAWVTAEVDGGLQKGGALALYGIDATVAHRLATFAHKSKELPALTGAGGGAGSLVAWDDESQGHGIIKVAVRPDTHAETQAQPRSLSPEGTDADGPRLLARPDGYWVAWLAHKPQDGREGGLDGSELEAVAEGREFRWVEVAALDPSGVLVGPIRRATPASGHVSAFGLASQGDGVVIAVRDDEESREGAGGRILGVSLQGEVASAPVVLATGVGRGAPAMASVAPGLTWLAFGDASDRMYLLALGKGGEPLGTPSLEPTLTDARLLGRGGGSAPGLLIAAGQAVRTLICAP